MLGFGFKFEFEFKLVSVVWKRKGEEKPKKRKPDQPSPAEPNPRPSSFSPLALGPCAAAQRAPRSPSRPSPAPCSALLPFPRHPAYFLSPRASCLRLTRQPHLSAPSSLFPFFLAAPSSLLCSAPSAPLSRCAVDHPNPAGLLVRPVLSPSRSRPQSPGSRRVVAQSARSAEPATEPPPRSPELTFRRPVPRISPSLL